MKAAAISFAVGFLFGAALMVNRIERSHECVAACMEVTAKLPEVNK